MNDPIERQAAIIALLEKGQSSRRYKIGEIWELNFDEIREALATVPSAEPERKIGQWVYDENGMDWNLPAWVCSECHGRNNMIPTYIRGKDKMIKVEHPLRWAGSKYCPNCGAKMEADHD